MAILEIIIPTYNRFDDVLSRLEELAQQPKSFIEKTRIRIVDNGSAKAVRDDDVPLPLKEVVEIEVRERNVGLNQNLIQSIDRANSPYLVLLGDDDSIKKDYLANIFKGIETLEEDSNCIGILFKTDLDNYANRKCIKVDSLENLLDSINSFGNFLFISTWLIRTSSWQKYSFEVNTQTSGVFCWIVPFLLCLKEGQSICLETQEIVNYESTDLSKKWPWFRCLSAAFLIFHQDFGLSPEKLRTLKQKLINFGSINFSFIYESILAQYNGNVPSAIIDNFKLMTFVYKGLLKKQRVPPVLLVLSLKYPILRKFTWALNRLTRTLSYRQRMQKSDNLSSI
jgi:glycosyltransferase involved in cell wall biosynthesis